MSTRKATPLEVDKLIENYLRWKAKAMGYLLRRSRSRDPWADDDYVDNHLYMLVDDCPGNRFPFARAPYAAFGRGEGKPLGEIAEELGQLEFRLLRHLLTHQPGPATEVRRDGLVSMLP